MANGVTARLARQSLERRGVDYEAEVRRLLDAALDVVLRCGTTKRARVADIVAAALESRLEEGRRVLQHPRVFESHHRGRTQLACTQPVSRGHRPVRQFSIRLLSSSTTPPSATRAHIP